MPVRGPHNLVKYGSYQADAGLSVSVWNRLSTPKFGREQRWDPDVVNSEFTSMPTPFSFSVVSFPFFYYLFSLFSPL